MLGKTHIAATGAVVTVYLTNSYSLYSHDLLSQTAFIGAGCLGALLPDCDSKNSLINKILPLKIYKHLHHRGITHTLLGLLIFCLLLASLENILHLNSFWQYFNAYLMTGYLMHLVEDSFSLDGINWFYPLTSYDQYVWRRYHRLARKVNHFDSCKHPIRHWWGRGMRVGGTVEKYIFWLSLIIFVLQYLKLIFLILRF